MKLCIIEFIIVLDNITNFNTKICYAEYNFKEKKINIKKIEQLTYDSKAFRLLWAEKNKIYFENYDLINKKIKYSAVDENSKKIVPIKEKLWNDLNKNRISTDKIYMNIFFPNDNFNPICKVSILEGKILFQKRDLIYKAISDIWIMNIDGKNREKIIMNDFDINKINKKKYSKDFNEILESQLSLGDWSPKGKYFIYYKGDFYPKGNIYIFDYQAKREYLIPNPGINNKFIYSFASWNNDGNKIAFYVSSNKFFGPDYAFGDIYIAYLNIEY